MPEKSSSTLDRLDDDIVPQKPVILFVEDDADDIYICQSAFKRDRLDIEVRVVYTAREGIDWLTGVTPFNNRQLFPVPDMVITDLQTPNMTGLDLLRWARSTMAYQKLPIIIHSGTFQPGDRAEAMKHGATASIEKDASCRRLVEAVKHAIAPTR